MSKYPYDIKQQLFKRRLKKKFENSSLPPCFSLNDLLISAVHLHENEFLKSIGLDSQEINENGNYDTKKMRTKMQKAFYSINDSTLPYLIADYLYRNNIIFTDEQISYIKNKFGNNDFNFEFDYLGYLYDYRDPYSPYIGAYVFDIYQKTYVRASKTCDNSKNKLNKFQKFLCEFFSSFGQFTLCLVSFIMIPAIILSFASVGIVLGPLALGLTIGICGSLALSSGVIYMLTEKNKIDINGKLEKYFKESNKKRLLAKNKIGEPPQNTQATVEQKEEFTNNDEPATLQIPEASAMPPSEQYDNQQEPV